MTGVIDIEEGHREGYLRMLVSHEHFCYIEAGKVGELHPVVTQLMDKGTKI